MGRAVGSGSRSSPAACSTSPARDHIIVEPSDDEPADYVVARDSSTEDSVEVPSATRDALSRVPRDST